MQRATASSWAETAQAGAARWAVREAMGEHQQSKAGPARGRDQSKAGPARGRDQDLADWCAQEQRRPAATAEYRAALAWIERTAQDRREALWARLVDAFMPDVEIRRLADERAELLRENLTRPAWAPTSPGLAQRLSERVESLDARPLTWAGAARGDEPTQQALAGMLARVVCPVWWRRQLRRAVVLAREGLGRDLGEVCKRAGQVYCTDDSVARRMERTKANRLMMEATEIEDAAGEVITLSQAEEASTSNKAIRRGELMTRIRGCEEWADAAGLAGLFTTNTAPSRFHPQTMHGGANQKHDGSTPKDAQKWLRGVWAKTRAKLQRVKLPVYGFRVAEPHHDACPHWHMLLWCAPDRLAELQAIIRAHWLADAGDEPGAQEHRFKAKPLKAGGAAAYCAKYISKNIDDSGAVGAEGHRDTDEAGQTDWIGTGIAQRVEAWAAAHGIRQFQALGQPPVTVWRELRRVTDEAVRGAAPDVLAAHAAVSRAGARRASWRGYMAAQGGPMVGRAYTVRIERADEPAGVGRYGDTMPARILGVVHVSRPGELIASSRRVWKPRGAWAQHERAHAPIEGLGYGLRGAQPVPPRTRVNNCTGQGRPGDLMRLGAVGAMRDFSGIGGDQTTLKARNVRFHPHDPGATRGQPATQHHPG